ncbi:hypothetical protein DFS33DRAFT_905633 [Desarmillaria ectypa]|nr:hypothetical protein DFS33DRAFT_905633 [Desarmillaria ectypa]
MIGQFSKCMQESQELDCIPCGHLYCKICSFQLESEAIKTCSYHRPACCTCHMHFNMDFITEEQHNNCPFKDKPCSMRDVSKLRIRPTQAPRYLEAEILSLRKNLQTYEETFRKERACMTQEKDDLIASHRSEVAELMAKIFGLEESNRRPISDVSNYSDQLPQSANAPLKSKNIAVDPDKRACALQEGDCMVSEILGLKEQVTSLLASLRESKNNAVNQVAILESQKKLRSDKALLLAELKREKMLRNESQSKLDQMTQHLTALETILDNRRSSSKAEIQQLTTKSKAESVIDDLMKTHLGASRAKVDHLEARIRGLNVKLMASEDEYRRHKAHLECEVKRLLYQNEKKQIKLDGSQVMMRALKGRIRGLETELSDSQKLVAELEAYQQRAAELEVVNARLAPDLDSAHHLMKLLTTNNEVLLQKIVELGTNATGLEIKMARLTDEIGLLRQALREYEEEKEVEKAVFNFDE